MSGFYSAPAGLAGGPALSRFPFRRAALTNRRGLGNTRRVYKAVMTSGPFAPGFELSDFEKRLIHELSGDIGLSPTPYQALAEKMGVEETLILETIRLLGQRGLMRRFGVTLRHQKSGFSANALIVWKIEPDQAERAGRILVSYPWVSHCYQRRCTPQWPFNFYSMVHAQAKDALSRLAARMARDLGGPEYQILTSLAELKKTSMRYF